MNDIRCLACGGVLVTLTDHNLPCRFRAGTHSVYLWQYAELADGGRR